MVDKRFFFTCIFWQDVSLTPEPSSVEKNAWCSRSFLFFKMRKDRNSYTKVIRLEIAQHSLINLHKMVWDIRLLFHWLTGKVAETSGLPTSLHRWPTAVQISHGISQLWSSELWYHYLGLYISHISRKWHVFYTKCFRIFDTNET